MDDYGGRVVLRHVDHLRIGGDDLDDFLFDHHDLLTVGLEVARRLRFTAKTLDRVQHRALVFDDGFAQRGRPVEIATHHVHDIGIIEQRFHRVVPLLIDGQFGIDLALFEKAIRLPVIFEQRLDFMKQLIVARTRLGEKSVSLTRLTL